MGGAAPGKEGRNMDHFFNRYYINQGITGTQLNYSEFRRGPPLDDTS